MPNRDQLQLRVVATVAPTERDWADIESIRRKHTFPSALDPRYWHGGLHEPLTAAALKQRQAGAKASTYFLLSYDEPERAGSLVAFARVSIDDSASHLEIARRVWDANVVTAVHVIAADPRLRGRAWQLRHAELGIFAGRLGDAFYACLFAWCRHEGVDALVANVAVSPIPNLPSLQLHRRCGFVSLGESSYEVTRHDENRETPVQVRFIQLWRRL